MIETLILILILILFLKWILILLAFPWVCLLFQYRRRKGIIGRILAVPGYVLEKFTSEGASRYIIINIGYIPSVSVRKCLYKMIGVKVEKNVVFHYRTEIRDPNKLDVGKGSIIGDNAILDARNGLILGKNVNLSSNVSIYTEQHDYKDELFRCSDKKNKSVIIGDRAWIGSNVIVLPGVRIGEGVICCAGCVVTKDVAPFDVVAGIPAKKISTRPKSLSYEFDGSSCWFY